MILTTLQKSVGLGWGSTIYFLKNDPVRMFQKQKKAMVGAQGKDNRWKGIVSLSEELCHKDYSLATF